MSFLFSFLVLEMLQVLQKLPIGAALGEEQIDSERNDGEFGTGWKKYQQASEAGWEMLKFDGLAQDLCMMREGADAVAK